MSALPAGYEICGDTSRIDAAAAHAYLTRSYWSPGIALTRVEKALANSLCVAIFHQEAQVALARVVTDYATFAYLADVYVLEDHRGQGLSHILVDWLQTHPDLQGLRRWALFTQDAHELYAKHGWSVFPHPDRLMTRDNTEAYA